LLTETQIIKGCRRGDKRTQYELVKRYSGMLMMVCRRYVSDESTSKDILQESLLRIFRHIDDYKKTGSFEAWMRKITVRCALAYLDRKDVRRETSIIDINYDEPIDALAIDRLSANEILSLVDSLPTGFRTVFNLVAIEGYSHKEVANLLNITESASRSQLTRARKMLQRKYTLMMKQTKSA